MFTLFKRNNKISFPEYTDEEIDQILDEVVEGNLYELKPISDMMQIAFVITCPGGLYFFTSSKTDSKTSILSDIQKAKEMYCLPAQGAFFFVKTHKTNYFSNGYEFVEIKEMPTRFLCLYTNNHRPALDCQFIDWQTDYDKLFEPELPEAFKDENGDPVEVEDTGEISFVAPIISKTALKLVEDRLDNAEVQENSDIKYDEETGQKYRKASVRSKLFHYSFRDEWYPVAADDPKIFSLKTLLGGWFGFHKFITGEKLQGLVYFLTCGGFGIFYLFDLASILLGNYYITKIEYDNPENKYQKTKTRLYLDKIDTPIFCLIVALAGIVISYISTRFIYMNILEHFTNGFTNAMLNALETAQQTVQSIE